MLTNNQMKDQILSQMHALSGTIAGKIDVLEALDNDASEGDCFDLHDQITTMHSTRRSMTAVIDRAMSIVKPSPQTKASIKALALQEVELDTGDSSGFRAIMYLLYDGMASDSHVLDIAEDENGTVAAKIVLEKYPDCNAVMVKEGTQGAEPYGMFFILRPDHLSVAEAAMLQI